MYKFLCIKAALCTGCSVEKFLRVKRLLRVKNSLHKSFCMVWGQKFLELLQIKALVYKCCSVKALVNRFSLYQDFLPKQCGHTEEFLR